MGLNIFEFSLRRVIRIFRGILMRWVSLPEYDTALSQSPCSIILRWGSDSPLSPFLPYSLYLIPHPFSLIAHPSSLTQPPIPSPLLHHRNRLYPHPSSITPPPILLIPHTSHLIPHTSSRIVTEKITLDKFVRICKKLLKILKKIFFSPLLKKLYPEPDPHQHEKWDLDLHPNVLDPLHWFFTHLYFGPGFLVQIFNEFIESKKV